MKYINKITCTAIKSLVQTNFCTVKIAMQRIKWSTSRKKRNIQWRIGLFSAIGKHKSNAIMFYCANRSSHRKWQFEIITRLTQNLISRYFVLTFIRCYIYNIIKLRATKSRDIFFATVCYVRVDRLRNVFLFQIRTARVVRLKNLKICFDCSNSEMLNISEQIF